MRFIETSMLICELVLLIAFLVRPIRSSKYYRLLLFLPLLFFLIHATIEGLRWQMFAAYGIAGLLAVAGSTGTYKNLPKYLKVTASFIGTTIVCVSFLLGYLLPVFQLPDPSGEFAVGKISIYLQDSSRPELITSDSTDKRELMVQVWYPAEQTGQGTVAYIHPEVAETVIQYFGLPGFISRHLSLIQTNALQDVPVVSGQGKFPLIIFSPGYMTHSSMYTSLLETWASHGYIVLSIDYTYESPAVIFPDQGVKYYGATHTNVWEGASWDTVQASIEGFRQSQDDSVKLKHLRHYLELMPYSARVNNWVKDVRFVIDQLHSKEQLPSVALFKSMDIENIAVAGHSVGGATSAVAAANDHRIKAAINMDGSQWGNLLGQKIHQPFLWLTAQREGDHSNSTMDLDAFIYQQVADEVYHLEVAKATHANFYDLSLWSNYPPLTNTGTIDGYRMMNIINDITIAFLDHYLKNEPIDFDDLQNRFDELYFVDE